MKVMRKIMKIAIGAAMACGAAVAVAAPAAAQVSFGVGVGPAYGYGYPAPVVPAYSCYDGYGNYLYSYPYCTAYAAPVYGGPVVEPYFGIGIGGYGWGGGRHFEGGGFRGGFAGGHGFVGRTGGGRAASGGGGHHHG
jgi:hypothetical protein